MKKIDINNVDLSTAVQPKNFDIAYPVKLKDLKNGEFFITTLKSNTVYVKSEYDQSEKKYYCENYNDYNNGKYFDGNKIVYFGFTYETITKQTINYLEVNKMYIYYTDLSKTEFYGEIATDNTIIYRLQAYGYNAVSVWEGNKQIIINL